MGRLTLCSLALLTLLALAPAKLEACNCTCYFSSDCSNTGRGTICDRSTGCHRRNKPDTRINGHLICGSPVGQPHCDGECKGSRNSDARWKDVSPDQVAAGLDLLLSGFLDSGANNGGPPSPVFLEVFKDLGLPEAWSEELQRATLFTLDIAFGFDLIMPPPGELITGDPCGATEVPEMSEVPYALLAMMRDSLVTGIVSGDPTAPMEPLEAFWSAQEDDDGEPWHPLHSGRCYPHGHDEVPDFDSVGRCQGEELSALLRVLLDGR